MKWKSHRKKLLEEIEKTGTVEAACRKTGISRTTFYKWIKRRPKFGDQIEEALFMVRDRVNDVAESKVMTGVMTGDGPSTRYWLGHNHPRYMNSKAKPEKSTLGMEKRKSIAGFKVVIVRPPGVPMPEAVRWSPEYDHMKNQTYEEEKKNPT